MAHSQPLSRQTSAPSYCPKCQRLYRRTPPGYRCVSDGTPLIDAGDPIPATWSGGIVSVGVTLTTIAAVVGLSFSMM